MKRTHVLNLVLVGGMSLMTCTLSAQNIQWRGTDRTGVYGESGLLKVWPADGPDLLWHFDELGEGHTSTAIDSEKIYITGLKDSIGSLYVFDLNGKLLNKTEYGRDWHTNYIGPRGTVTVNEGKVYLISGYGHLYCFHQQNLNLVWEKDLLSEFNASNIEWGICEAPLIIGEKLIATPGGKEHNVVALDKNTGERIWSCPGEGDLSAYCSPLYIADQKVPLIVTMTADHIIGIEAETGEKLWSCENKNRYSVHANTPVYSDNQLLCTSGYGRGSTMLRLVDGGRKVETVWFSEEMDNRIGSMVKVGDYVYGSGDSKRYWFCADWKTGEIKYREQGLAMGNIIANVTADDQMLYCYTDRGEMILAKANPEKFDRVSRFPVTLGTEQHWAHPVIYRGVMYVRHGNALMAYRISE